MPVCTSANDKLVAPRDAQGNCAGSSLRLLANFHAIPAFFSAFVALIGGVVIVGWYAKIMPLITLVDGFPPMKFNAALGLLVSGIASLMATLGFRRVSLFGSGLALLLGAFTITQDILDIDFGIDNILMAPLQSQEVLHQGRMAPNAALCLTLSGLAMLTAGLPVLGEKRWRYVGVLAALVTGFGVVGLSGYLIGVPTTYGWGRLGRFAAHAAIGFILLGCAQTMLAWQKDVSRWSWFPVSVGVSIFAISVMLWQALSSHEIGHARMITGAFILVFGLMMACALAFAMSVAIRARRLAAERAEEIVLREGVERSLRDSEAQVRMVLNGLKDYSMIMLTPDGIINSWNFGAERIKGYTREEAVGRHFSIFMTVEDRVNGVADQMLRTALERGKCEIEARRVRKDGRLFWAAIVVEPLRDSEGRLLGFVKGTRDISERKVVEEEREKLVARLTESNTELERFAYVASHDMQEPVRMIINFTRIIAHDYDKLFDDAGREYLQQIVEAGVRMHAVIDDLLAYSRIGHGQTPFKTFHGEHVMTGVLDNISSLIDERKAVVTHVPMPDLYGNPVQILRLIQNLVTNAIKYQPPGNVPRIHVAVEDKDDVWLISVSDNGLGIDSKYVEEIFQPFRRLHTWEQINGTGLGLSICKKIVETHGGTMNVQSAPGKGSVFSFTLRKQIPGGQEAA